MTRTRNKTLATWLAFLGGALGLHRFYMHGMRDPWGWLHIPPTLVGLIGFQRMQQLGQDDRLAWALMPLLGLSLAVGMLSAIVYGLTSDEKWDARYNVGVPPSPPAGWTAIIGVIFALLIGATVTVSTIAFSVQRLVEIQAERGSSGI